MNSMDNTLTSVLAALGGSVIGATTPVLSNFVLQRSLTQRGLTNREIAQREDLYSEFIRQGTAYYAKALSQEAFVKRLVEKYGENNMSIDQIKSVALEQHADPLNDFALKCRAELREVYERATWRRR
jgi:hypothetical protein